MAIDDVLVEPLLPVSHVATARLVTLVMRTWVMSRASVGHLLNVEHHESSCRLNHPVVILPMSRPSKQRGECFVTVITLEVSTTVCLPVSLEFLLVVVALLTEVALELPAMDLLMAAEGRDPRSFVITVLTGMLHWRRLLTFDDVIPV